MFAYSFLEGVSHYYTKGGFVMKKLMECQDIHKIKYLSSLNTYEDCSTASFILSSADCNKNNYRSDIYYKDFEKGDIKRLTSCTKVNSYIYLDKDNILFTSKREPNLENGEVKIEGEELTRFYKISLRGGEAYEYFKIKKQVSQIEVIDEDTYIFKASFKPGVKEPYEMTREEMESYIKDKNGEEDFETLTTLPYSMNGAGFTPCELEGLYLYKKSLDTVVKLTKDIENVEGFKINKQQNTILYIASTFSEKAKLENNIHLYEINSGADRIIAKDLQGNFSYADFYKEDILFLFTDMQKYGLNENSQFYLFNIASGQYSKINAEGFTIGNSICTDASYGRNRAIKVLGDFVYFIVTEGTSSYLYKMDSKGHKEKVTNIQGSVVDFDVCKDMVIINAFREINPEELYQVSSNKEEKLTKFNEEIALNYELSKLEPLSIRVSDGTCIDGFVMKPQNYQEGKKYPGIFEIHGGPKTSYGSIFIHEMQCLCALGYFVFFCNPRGSDGKGDEFADIRGKYGTIDYDDLMNFKKEVLKVYKDIDENSIGVTGGSYGGFMTNWIIGHTNEFKAAVTQRSISNWMSMFGTTDIGYFFATDQVGAPNPYSDIDKFMFHSPIKYAENFKTPTLILHSLEDHRCYHVEAMQLFTALKFFEVPSKMVLFKGETHELSRSGKPLSRIKRLNEMTLWFSKYLK